MTDSIFDPYGMAIRFINTMERARVSGDYDDRYYYGMAKGYLQALDNNNLISEEQYKELFTKISYLKPSS